MREWSVWPTKKLLYQGRRGEGDGEVEKTAEGEWVGVGVVAVVRKVF